MIKMIPGLLDHEVRPKFPLLGASLKPYIPKTWHDIRSGTLEPSNQLMTSECVLFANCGNLEVRNYKLFGDREQIDPHPAYKRAKEIDGKPGEQGTTLEAGIQAMIDVGYLKQVDVSTIRQVVTLNEVKRGLHRYDAVVCAWRATTNFPKARKDGFITPGGTLIGGHATLCTCYNEAENWIGWQDNYGPELGNQGNCRIPLDWFPQVFIYGLVFDFLPSSAQV